LYEKENEVVLIIALHENYDVNITVTASDVLTLDTEFIMCEQKYPFNPRNSQLLKNELFSRRSPGKAVSWVAPRRLSWARA
jgi:hypothetical protein